MLWLDGSHDDDGKGYNHEEELLSNSHLVSLRVRSTLLCSSAGRAGRSLARHHLAACLSGAHPD
jgi:hypothetical protein